MANIGKRITRKFRVHIDDNRTTVVLAENGEEAIQKAVKKIYGPECFWKASHGLKGFGQVFRSVKAQNYSNSVTYQVECTCEPLATKSKAFLAQEAADRAHSENAAAELNDRDDQILNAWSAGYHGLICPQYRANPILSAKEIAYHYERGMDDAKKMQAAAEDAARESEAEAVRMAEQEAAWAKKLADERCAEMRARAQLVAVERKRLLSIDAAAPITDPALAAIVRNCIARQTCAASGMPLGEWKRYLLGGNRPDLIADYLNSPVALEKIYNKLF